MTREAFEASLTGALPPAGLPPLLEALWYDARGDWKHAHDIAQDIHTENGAWIHAYLHRKEGDLGNAAYWYRRANRPLPAKSLEEESKQITEALLQDEGI